MKTYKGLLCSLFATRMLLAQETPTIQTQPQASEAQSSQEAVIEYEKQLIANAMTGESSSGPRPSEVTNAEQAEADAETTEQSGDSTDASTFASAQKLFNEMWGVKETAKPKKPNVISTKESNPSTTSAQIATTLPPNNLIPFVQEKTYAENPVAGADVKLPPMPDTLLPMGKPKLVAVAPKPKPKIDPLANAPTPDKKESHANGENNSEDASSNSSHHKPSQPSPADEPQIAVSPFLQWIKENQKSPELAKEALDQYKSNESQKDSTSADDVFLKIRFPYTGSQTAPPSGGGAVIYSTPQK